MPDEKFWKEIEEGLTWWVGGPGIETRTNTSEEDLAILARIKNEGKKTYEEFDDE